MSRETAEDTDFGIAPVATIVARNHTAVQIAI